MGNLIAKRLSGAAGGTALAGRHGRGDRVQLSAEVAGLPRIEQAVLAAAGDSKSHPEAEASGQECSRAIVHTEPDFRGLRLP